MATDTDTPTAVIDTYLAAYAEPDPTRRRELIVAAFVPDGRLVDPPLEGAGHAGIDEMAVAVQGQFAGHRFGRTTGVDHHHGFARYGWELVAPDGTVVVAGMDVVELAPDGRIRLVTGFFGDLPPI
jgi:hypothetical protein